MTNCNGFIKDGSDKKSSDYNKIKKKFYFLLELTKFMKCLGEFFPRTTRK